MFVACLLNLLAIYYDGFSDTGAALKARDSSGGSDNVYLALAEYIYKINVNWPSTMSTFQSQEGNRGSRILSFGPGKCRRRQYCSFPTFVSS